MIRIIVTLLLFLTAISVFPQSKDKQATTLLDEVSVKTKSYKSIKADFSYSMENQQAKINEEKKGTLLLSGDKYRLNAGKQIVICDGITIWTYLEESNEVQINTLDNKDEALTPSKLLSSYNESYRAKIIKDKKQTDPNIETIELTPKKVKNFIKAILSVDKSKKQIKSFALHDKSGNVFTYHITRYQTDIPIEPSDFSFDKSKFPGVEMIDMR